MPRDWRSAIEYVTSPFFLFDVLVLYETPTWKGFYNMNKKLLFGLLALGVAMLVAGLVIVFVGLS
jgi:hypothetical protein